MDGIAETSDGIRTKVGEFVGDRNRGGIRFWSDDESNYDDYLVMYNSILSGYRDVLDAYLIKNFSTSYRETLKKPFDGRSLEARKAAHEKFPQMIFELSDQERFLLVRNVPEFAPLFEGE